MNTKMYMDFIKEALANEGIEVADKANKIALEMNKITLDQYRAAAQIIVKAYMERT